MVSVNPDMSQTPKTNTNVLPKNTAAHSGSILSGTARKSWVNWDLLQPGDPQPPRPNRIHSFEPFYMSVALSWSQRLPLRVFTGVIVFLSDNVVNHSVMIPENFDDSCFILCFSSAEVRVKSWHIYLNKAYRIVQVV